MSQRVLLVEDDEDAAILLIRLLERRGFVAAWAATVAQAVTVATRERPDILVTDMVLPDGDGIHLAGELRRRLSPPPVMVALSGRAERDMRELATNEGFAGYFVKPVDVGMFVRCLRELAPSPLG